jgi:hypothetical protein
MSILSIDLHSSKSSIRLSFYFQNVTYESLDDIYCSKFSTFFSDLNPIEHIWDMLGRRMHAREYPVQNIRQLEAALSLMNHLTTYIVQSSVPGVTPTCLDDGLNPASHPSS